MLVFEKRLSILANFALEIFPLTFSNAVYTEGGGARGEEEENNDSARISRCTKLDGGREERMNFPYETGWLDRES